MGLTEAKKEYMKRRYSFQEQRRLYVRKKYKAMLKKGYSSTHIIRVLAAKFNCVEGTIYSDLNISQIKKELRAMQECNP